MTIPGELTPRSCRPLTQEERTRLVANHNSSDNWDDVSVRDPFDPDLIRNSTFVGTITIGRVQSAEYERDVPRLPVGITNCFIVSSDIGDDCAVHDVRYIERTRVGDSSVVFNVDEIGPRRSRSEPVRIAVMNEAGGRAIVPFPSIRPADAYLWAKYRDDEELMSALNTMTMPRASCGHETCKLGERVTITHCGSLRGVVVGPSARIDGVSKIADVTIESSPDARTYIGDNTILTEGIVGFGSRVHRAVIGNRFVFGENVEISNGARVIDSVIGDNSTISCCEVLNTLAFPAHEQHHNNSFLIAALVMGQSNIAAGVTIGSNHNSRANDGEVEAGRGFWPGLCVSLKHPSRFASFILIAKADYPAELDVPFPFSLVSNNNELNRLEIRPAYWWLNNTYALFRNAAKFRDRDTRVHRFQHIETEFLAPDTAEQIISAMNFLDDAVDGVDPIDATGRGFERSRRAVAILHPREAYVAYRQMLTYYAVRAIVTYIESTGETSFETLIRESVRVSRRWLNLGGQVLREDDLDRLRSDAVSGSLPSWDAIHARYDELHARYARDCALHAIHVLGFLNDRNEPTVDDWHTACDDAVGIAILIAQRVYETRKKDFDDGFRRITFRNEKEMIATVGTIDDNSTVKHVRSDVDRFVNRVHAAKRRLL